ncbi:MAG TPA: hypothetical protein VGP63_27420 [Planctomycetaceae bacterium]|jgi:hypothetical protein|nr:hypothetical protein [Planctomycetaceae bacterium]
MDPHSRGLFEGLVGDGRPLILFTGICLALSGAFALFQSSTGHFLPHDVAFLQMAPQDLCGINQCRIVHFMFHDRVSFGGALIAIAVLYLWLAAFPLAAGEPWSWWTLLASGIVGFGSFLTYLGYGYLDTWHGAATLVLLPCFVTGLWLTRPARESGRSLSSLRPAAWWPWKSPGGIGRVCLLAAALGMIGAGITIQAIGMTSVFVPTDLTFMGIEKSQFDAINPRLVPLIAHDRAGFGGATTTAGLLTFASVWFASPTRALWQALLLGGLAGWTAAIGVHPVIGYTEPIHLAPAVVGALLFFTGLALTRSPMGIGSLREAVA